jgi:hypothetical protein
MALTPFPSANIPLRQAESTLFYGKMYVNDTSYKLGEGFPRAEIGGNEGR